MNLQTNTYKQVTTDPISRLIHKLITLKNNVFNRKKQKAKASPSISDKLNDPFMINDYIAQALRDREINNLKEELVVSTKFFIKQY